MSTIAARVKQRILSIYRGPIRTASVRTGLHGFLVFFWEYLRKLLVTIEYRRAPNPYSVSVAGSEAVFHYSTKAEFERITGLSGEREVVAYIINELEEDDVVWDIGAHIGTHACLLASSLPNGTVIAFEPNPIHANRLADNVQANGLKNVELKRVAVGDRTGVGQLKIVSDELHMGRNTLIQDAYTTTESKEVDLRQGDELIAEDVPIPTVLKIDVEGAELDVLRGMRETLSDPSCRLVVCEVHKSRGVSIHEVTDSLVECGFNINVLKDRGTEQFVSAEK